MVVLPEPDESVILRDGTTLVIKRGVVTVGAGERIESELHFLPPIEPGYYRVAVTGYDDGPSRLRYETIDRPAVTPTLPKEGVRDVEPR